MNKFAAASIAALALVSRISTTTVEAAGAVEITSRENFDEVTKGKNALVKFLAPWYVVAV